jgi:hypothetical protein
MEIVRGKIEDFFAGDVRGSVETPSRLPVDSWAPAHLKLVRFPADSWAPAHFDLSVFPSMSLASPRLHSFVATHRGFALITRTAILAAATLAASPSTRAISYRDVFYVAFPKSSIVEFERQLTHEREVI